MPKKLSRAEYEMLMIPGLRGWIGRCPVHGLFELSSIGRMRRPDYCPQKCREDVEWIDDPKQYAKDNKRKGVAY